MLPQHQLRSGATGQKCTAGFAQGERGLASKHCSPNCGMHGWPCTQAGTELAAVWTAADPLSHHALSDMSTTYQLPPTVANGAALLLPLLKVLVLPILQHHTHVRLAYAVFAPAKYM